MPTPFLPIRMGKQKYASGDGLLFHDLIDVDRILLIQPIKEQHDIRDFLEYSSRADLKEISWVGNSTSFSYRGHFRE